MANRIELFNDFPMGGKNTSNSTYQMLQTTIRVVENDSNKTEYELDAYFDTGFFGGLRLPKYFEGRLLQSRPTKVLAKIVQGGRCVGRNIPAYSLNFDFKKQDGLYYPMSSSTVIFYGDSYALIGLDFLREWECLLSINGIASCFSLSSRM